MSGHTPRLGGRVVPGGDTNTPLAVSRVAIAALTVLFAGVALADVTIPLTAQAGVYLLGMVAMNLPHGGFTAPGIGVPMALISGEQTAEASGESRGVRSLLPV